MAIYNTGCYFDKLPQDGGILYNGKKMDRLINIVEQAAADDLKTTFGRIIELIERLGATDALPKKAISDFSIGTITGKDKAYDWLSPFNLKIDWGNTKIQVMPQAEITSIEMPGMDGSIVENTVYKDRLFNIVAFSEQGLTSQEKETLKADITQILDSTKMKSKKLSVQSRGTSFDVRYEGQAEITEGPSYVKAVIPFRATPYGYNMFDNSIPGAGLIENPGITKTGTVHRITGPITNPSFTLDGTKYSWSGNVPSGSTLVISFENMTCYLEDSNGVKRNAMNNFKGKMTNARIEPKSSAVLAASDDVAARMSTTWKVRVLW